jgi:hypothetical protein
MTSEERSHQIEHEKFIAQILAIRTPPHQPPSALTTWLNSNVLTALIGVVGTAILGSYISGQIQERARQNELERAATVTRLENRRALVSKVVDRVSTFMTASDDLLVTVNVSYDETARRSDEVKKLRAWKTDLAVARDKAEAEWRRGTRSVALGLDYEFNGAGDVTKAWKELARSVDAFERCTSDWYNQNALIRTTLSADRICPDERAAAEQASEVFVVVTRTPRATPVEEPSVRYGPANQR